MKLTGILLMIGLCGAIMGCGRTSSEDSASDEEAVSVEERASDEDDEESVPGCDYEDGTHWATVDYYNPDTGYSTTYDLEVEVLDCEVIQINFSSGGWLDEDHIDATRLDENGEATIEDDRGRIFEIHLN